MTDERIVVLDLVRHSGLNAIAQECHRLAVARGEYLDSWDLWTGYTHMDNELEAWWDAAQCGDSAGEIEEMGDLLHTVLSVAHHRGIDVEAALRGAMQRNAERARPARYEEALDLAQYLKQAILEQAQRTGLTAERVQEMVSTAVAEAVGTLVERLDAVERHVAESAAWEEEAESRLIQVCRDVDALEADMEELRSAKGTAHGITLGPVAIHGDVDPEAMEQAVVALVRGTRRRTA